ncbi:MAG TPA: hypothetical protein VHF89_12995, partial [Solirubrobacteraceae bacterium]|nr:hypothetical protein [Solirubrobacteraceae bacterium]
MRSFARALGAALVLAAAFAAAAPGAQAGSVYARVDAAQVVLGNSVAERRWARAPMRTLALVDKRGRDRTWSTDTSDFALDAVDSRAFAVTRVDRAELPGGGLRLTMTLTGVPGLTVKRIAEAYPGVAGFRTQTVIEPAATFALGSAVLEEAATGAGTPTLHAFRAGADWRDAEWTGPDLQIGDPHAGTWRETTTAGRGEAVSGSGQWLSVADGERSLFLVAEG